MWAAAAGMVGASVIGNMANSRAQRDAQNRLNEIMQRYANIKVPTVEEQKLILQDFKSAGLLTPELEQAILQPESVLNQFQEDPRLRDAQLGALTKLQEIADEGGMNLQDKARMAQIQQEVGADDKGRREAIMQSMARRGAAGSGSELAALLQGSQASTNRQAMEGLNVQAMAQQRALDSIMQGANLGGQVRGQDFDIAARRAQAQDSINQFNTNLRNQAQSNNVNRKNQSQQFNLQNQQQINNDNVKMGNFQQQYNKELEQQRFNNEMSRAQGMSGVNQAQAQMDLNRGQQQAQIWGGVGQGIGQFFTASQMNKQGADKKTDDDDWSW